MSEIQTWQMMPEDGDGPFTVVEYDVYLELSRHLTSQLEALRKENEELRKERDLFKHNLNKYIPNKKYQEILDDIAKLRRGV